MRGDAILRFAPLLVAASGFGLPDVAWPQAATAHSAVPPPVDADFLRVRKAARVIEIWSGERLAHVIENIQLGDAPIGHKRFEGDERTPEGLYEIDWGNPRSAYTLSLHISYPNEADRAYARSRGRSAGGMIMIHGQPNGYSGERVPGDWTDGCIAVSNAEITFLWQSVADGTPIEILP